MLQDEDCTIKKTGVIYKHFQSLIAAGLVVQDQNDKVPVDFPAFCSDVLEHLLTSSHSLQDRVGLFVFKLSYRFVVNISELLLKISLIFVRFFITLCWVWRPTTFRPAMTSHKLFKVVWCIIVNYLTVNFRLLRTLVIQINQIFWLFLLQTYKKYWVLTAKNSSFFLKTSAL